MGRIALAVRGGQLGHLNCAIALAKQLRGARHDVSFVEVSSDPSRDFSEERAYLASHGFASIGLAAGQAVGAASASPPSSAENLAVLLRRADALRAQRWDLVIADFHNSAAALVAHKARVKCVLLATTLPEWDRQVPPLDTTLVPGSDLESRLRTWLAWKRVDLRAALAAPSVPRLFRRDREISGARVLRDFGVPSLRVTPSRSGLVLNLPTLIACPRPFDFEQPRGGNEYYVDALVDQERQEAATQLDWGAGAGRAKLIYTSVGTQGWFMKDSCRFFRTVIEAVRGAPDWQLILNVGAAADRASLDPPRNVLVVDRAPQLAVLSRASLMITHGGLNSVKESIVSGVPMLVFPVVHDQAGNAARVKHHRLGLFGDYRSIDAKCLEAMIREVLSNPSFRLAIDRMRERFEEARRDALALRVVEQVLALPEAN